MFQSLFSQVKGKVSDAITKTVGQPQDLKQEIIIVEDKRVAIREKLGEGGFAYVYSVEEDGTGQSYALKRILCQTEEQRQIAAKEIAILKRLKHPNIITYFGASKRTLPGDTTEYFILMELCNGSLVDLMTKAAGGSLYTQSSEGDVPKRKGKFSEKKICHIFKHICQAIQVLHNQRPPIAHRDIKIENVLVGADGNYKLCDFGSCTTKAGTYKTKEDIAAEEENIQKNSTAMYRAPEMADLWRKQKINEKVDIWALGCILYTLAFFSHPFQEGGTLQIISGKYDIPEDQPYSKYLLALLKRLLTPSPKKRPDIAQVIQLTQIWEHWLKTGEALKITPSPGDAKTKSKKESDSDEEPEPEASPRVPPKRASVAPASKPTSASRTRSPTKAPKKETVQEDWATEWDAPSKSPPPTVAPVIDVSPAPTPTSSKSVSASSAPPSYSSQFFPDTGKKPSKPSSQTKDDLGAMFDSFDWNPSHSSSPAVSEPKKWRCASCTFDNSEPTLVCRMCQTQRPSPRASAAPAPTATVVKASSKPSFDRPSSQDWASFDDPHPSDASWSPFSTSISETTPAPKTKPLSPSKGKASSPTKSKPLSSPTKAKPMESLQSQFSGLGIEDADGDWARDADRERERAAMKKKSSAPSGWAAFDEIDAELSGDEGVSHEELASSPRNPTTKPAQTKSHDDFAMFDWDNPGEAKKSKSKPVEPPKATQSMVSRIRASTTIVPSTSKRGSSRSSSRERRSKSKERPSKSSSKKKSSRKSSKKTSKARLHTSTMPVGSQGSDYHSSPQSSPPSSGAGTPNSGRSLTPTSAEVIGKGGELLGTSFDNSDDFSPIGGDLPPTSGKKLTGSKKVTSSKPKSKKKDSALLD